MGAKPRRKDRGPILSVKWTGKGSARRAVEIAEDMDLDRGLYTERFLRELMWELQDVCRDSTDEKGNVYSLVKPLADAGLDTYPFRMHWSQRQDYPEDEIWRRMKKQVPKIKEFLGGRKWKEIVDSYVDERMTTAHTILLDFPDYDRSAKGKMRRDLRDFQEYWEDNILEVYETGHTEQGANIVVFWQKEAWPRP